MTWRKSLKGGEIVEINLSGKVPANVKLMDSYNFSNYKNGRRHTYYGGHATRSPVRIPRPCRYQQAIGMQQLILADIQVL